MHTLSEEGLPFMPKTIHNIAEWQQLVARQAHNLEVIGSNPISATTSGSKVPTNEVLYFFYADGMQEGSGSPAVNTGA